MNPTYRAARIMVDLHPTLREAVEAAARTASERTHRRVTMSDVIRDLVTEHLLDDSKKAGVA